MDSGWIAGLAALGGSLVGGVGATVGTWWFDLRAERREGRAAGRVIYRELMHNGTALSTFRKTEGEWLSEPTNSAWLTYGMALPRILDEEEWPFVAAGYPLMGYWRGLSHDADAEDILNETAGDIREAMAILVRFLGVSQEELLRRHAAAESSRSVPPEGTAEGTEPDASCERDI